jgi:hypothetical protein
MTPYYEADTLFRIMDNRFERVKLARIFYLEYLKLMNHFELLDLDVKKKWKFLMHQIEKEEDVDEEQKQYI